MHSIFCCWSGSACCANDDDGGAWGERVYSEQPNTVGMQLYGGPFPRLGPSGRQLAPSGRTQRPPSPETTPLTQLGPAGSISDDSAYDNSERDDGSDNWAASPHSFFRY